MKEMEGLSIRLSEDLDRWFPDLVRALEHDLYSGLRSLAGSDAEDLAQETFVRAYQAMSEYPPSRIAAMALRPWIWTIALNLGRNHLRALSRRPRVVELEEIGRPDPEPVDSMAWERRLNRLALPIRRAVVLRHVVGLDYVEIAAALDRPIGTVKADVHRGLERLRKMMEDENEH
jgi:RNA polymerase sigma-70 factor (ECF subfamily)